MRGRYSVAYFAAIPAHEIVSRAQTIRILDLERHRDLFRDAAAFDQFLAAIAHKVTPDGLTILAKGDVALATLSPANRASEMFQLRIAACLATDPKLLDDLNDRISD